MNVFGAFTFGSLIKTFLPGFVWGVALVLLWHDLHVHLGGVIPAIPDVAGEEQNVLLVAFPAAILLGLLSNIVMFMGVNDWLVRRPVRARNPDLFHLYDRLGEQIRAWHQTGLSCLDDRAARAYGVHADPELLILKSTGISDLAYVREQYWYHMEFQTNMLSAIFVTLLTLLADPAVLGSAPTPAAWERGALAVVALGGLCHLLRRAALKNYQRHIAKMCTLMAAAIRRDQQPPAAATEPSLAPACPCY